MNHLDFIHEQLVVARLLFGRERELILAAAHLTHPLEQVAVWEGAHSELAARLEVSVRTIRRLAARVKARQLTWLQIDEHPGIGHTWSFELAAVDVPSLDILVTPDKPRTNLGHTPDKPRTNLGHTPDKPRTNLGQKQGGTKSATCTGVTIPSKSTTYSLRECESDAHTPTPAREDSPSRHFALQLHGWIEQKYAELGVRVDDLSDLSRPLLKTDDGDWEADALFAHITQELPAYRMRCRSTKSALSALLGDMRKKGITPESANQDNAQQQPSPKAEGAQWTPQGFRVRTSEVADFLATAGGWDD